MGNHDKIPSVISYSPSKVGKEQQWGSDLSQNAVAVVHSKLRLHPNSNSEELDHISRTLDVARSLSFQHIRNYQRRPLSHFAHKSDEEVVTDYLSRVFQHLLRAVDRFSDVVRETFSVDFVFTMPTVCAVPIPGWESNDSL
jgi:hypothetical protein